MVLNRCHGIGEKKKMYRGFRRCALLGTDVLQSLGAVLVGEVDGIVLGLEVEVGALHVVGR
jgi:hypothetical protein